MKGDVKVTKDGKVILILGSSPISGDMHETLGVDREGKILDGHTTVRIGGNRSVHMPWGDKPFSPLR